MSAIIFAEVMTKKQSDCF